MSADEPLVGAWKLRAIVYGMLLAVGALVWVARPSTPARTREEPLVTFRGSDRADPVVGRR
jgi:hypothetical protein